jgi:hypothetical protein
MLGCSSARRPDRPSSRASDDPCLDGRAADGDDVWARDEHPADREYGLLMRHGRIPSSSRPTLDRRNAPRRRPLFAAAATAASLSLLGAACESPSGAGVRPTAPSVPVETSAARLGIRPADGVSDADPEKGISVSVARGTITNVTVRTPADPVQGRLARGDRRWHSIWALNTNARYTVVATAVDRVAGRSRHGVRSERSIRLAPSTPTSSRGIGRPTAWGCP